ncbi:MAG: hypothetical protein KAU21_11515, partial [Gammaproteobacteria bacterium]|nr:hypothetical protein [Gammaproteobacteria bacterium]
MIKSIHLKNILSKLLLVFLFTPLTLSAQVFYQMYGNVAEITNTTISISDGRITLSPTVKIVLEEEKKGRLEDIKKGDRVRILVLKLD